MYLKWSGGFSTMRIAESIEARIAVPLIKFSSTLVLGKALLTPCWNMPIIANHGQTSMSFSAKWTWCFWKRCVHENVIRRIYPYLKVFPPSFWPLGHGGTRVKLTYFSLFLKIFGLSGFCNQYLLSYGLSLFLGFTLTYFIQLLRIYLKFEI